MAVNRTKIMPCNCIESGDERITIGYLPYGTIGWLKCANNEVRQCKCVGIVWDAISEYSTSNKPIYEWKVAGIEEHQSGDHRTIFRMGTIYRTEEIAQLNCNNNQSYDRGLFLPLESFSLRDLAREKYGITKFSVVCYHTHALSCYTIKRDNTIQTEWPSFSIVMDKHGIDLIVPSLDNGSVFTTMEDAKSHVNKGKVYTLDDEDEEETPKTESVTITIKVDVNRLEDIKRISTIID